MTFKSINPYNQEKIATYDEHSYHAIEQRLSKASDSFSNWRQVPISQRCVHLLKAADLLRENKETYARTMTLEMGKPIKESVSEIEKCAWVCEFYAENAERFLADQIIETDASESFISHDPLGPVLAIMPWNFPFWQVFRFAAPSLAAGNVALLKHAPNVFGCASHIEDLFKEAGFPEGVFQNLFIHHEKVEGVIADDRVKAATLTGSERAGSSVAALAGEHIKKTVLELGGSNSFIVWDDADMDQAVETGVTARMMNSGQSCIAAKRFILVGDAYETFLPAFQEKVKELKSGDPLEESTDVGPLARTDLAEKLEQQVNDSVKKGAQLLMGGERDEAYYTPTILTNVEPGIPAFDEELFGPVASFIRAESEDEAFELAAKSKYGLGTTVFTKDTKRALKSASKVPDGAYFINELVKSDPRLPFGGTKNSGYGRELSREGILEFVNKKTVYVK
jgi:succinate-semialdehyde dehydrogenase/glutarate-semialdehyde dehydrogenase